MNIKLVTSELFLSGAFLLLATCGTVETVLAEGSITRPIGGGEWGVNRRVTSDVENVGVSGTFSTTFGLPQDASGNVTPASNPQNSSPSFYLDGSGTAATPAAWGGQTNLEVDAGLQWDWSNTPMSPRGWVAFISVNTVQTNPAIYDEDTGDYAPWRGNGGVYNLGYRVASNGAIRLNVDGLGTFYWNDAARPATLPDSTVWPNVGAVVMNPTLLDSQRVKRVIALTRANNFTDGLDGSWVRCVFRNGRIVHSNGQEEDWTWQDVNNAPNGNYNPTGYDTPAGGLPSIDATRNGGRSTLSRYKVDFPSLGGATPTPGTSLITAGRSTNSTYSTEVEKSRYNAETVRINLRTFHSLFGRRVRVGP